MIRRDLQQEQFPFSDANQVATENNPSVNLSEPEAIERAQRGEASAFEHLYNRYKRRVHAICLRIVSNPEEAEDLTQEAFLLVFRKIHTFRGASAFSTWLHRLALNVAYMHLRRKAPSSTSFEELANPSGGYESPKEFGGPDAALEGFVDRVNLERALDTLAAPSKTVIVLHDVQGFKHREIAEILQCSVESSKGQLHRARARLRQLLRTRISGAPLVLETTDEHQLAPTAC